MTRTTTEKRKNIVHIRISIEIGRSSGHSRQRSECLFFLSLFFSLAFVDVILSLLVFDMMSRFTNERRKKRASDFKIDANVSEEEIPRQDPVSSIFLHEDGKDPNPSDASIENMSRAQMDFLPMGFEITNDPALSLERAGFDWSGHQNSSLVAHPDHCVDVKDGIESVLTTKSSIDEAACEIIINI